MPEEIKKTTNLKKLVKLAHNNAFFFKDPDSRAFARIKIGKHHELYPLRSSSFEDWLSAINFKEFDEVALSKLKSDVTLHLEGTTRLLGDTHAVSLRVYGMEKYIELDLGDKANSLTGRLSVGQQQRAAIARAIINQPAVIFADEPTSALDDDNTQQVIQLLQSQAAAVNATLLIVTHDNRLTGIIPQQTQL